MTERAGGADLTLCARSAALPVPFQDALKRRRLVRRGRQFSVRLSTERPGIGSARPVLPVLDKA